MHSIYAFIVILAFASCGLGADIPNDVQQALQTPERVILYRLTPLQPRGDFHKCKIDSQIALSDPSAVQKVTQSIHASILEEVDPAFCFNPHHGVRVFYKKKIYDFVICYECKRYELFTTGMKDRGGNFGGTSDTFDRFLSSSTSK